MEREQVASTEIGVHVENIGGIHDADVSFAPGVNVLAGRNATNRTSLLQSVIAALGGSQVSLKGDADEGFVELTLGDETYTRRLVRQHGTVQTNGDPMLDDPDVADLFAFLLESNEARRAVVREDDLRDLIMRPVDTHSIQNEIRRLESEKREVRDQLAELESIADEIGELERERNLLTHKISETREDLEAKQAEIDADDDDIEETREVKAELEDRLDALNDVRSSFESVRKRLETEQKSLRALREEYESLEEKMASVPETPDADIEELTSRLDSLRSRKNSMESRVSDLNSIIQFNNEMVSGDGVELGGAVDDQSSDRPVTDGLLPADEVVCWTCGTTVEETAIEETIERLRDVKTDIQQERNELRAQIDELKSRKQELENQSRKREQIQRQFDQVEREIADREATIEDLTEERSALSDDLETMESNVEELQSIDYGGLLEKHKEANQLEFELERLSEEREDIDREIERKETQLSKREDLVERRAEIDDRLSALRGRIDQIEDDATTAFNEHMATILDLLNFHNIERIWIEKLDVDGDGESTFDLHIVRNGPDGVAYEDTIDHLSESEREVTGLIFALAGYLVHEVYEYVPIICLDSLEAVDSERIATLVEYFTEYADYLVVALLPEDADAIDVEHKLITEI